MSTPADSTKADATSADNSSSLPSSETTSKVRASLKKRYAAEKRFRWYGIIAISSSIGFLFILLALSLIHI